MVRVERRETPPNPANREALSRGDRRVAPSRRRWRFTFITRRMPGLRRQVVAATLKEALIHGDSAAIDRGSALQAPLMSFCFYHHEVNGRIGCRRPTLIKSIVSPPNLPMPR
jgi:hypothetical protein